MLTLYIIGNGFDREHGLKTSYWDFRKYLEKYAKNFLVQMESMYDIALFERLDKRFKKNREIQKHRDDIIYEALWKNFEYKLGEANEVEMLDFSESIVSDLDLNGGPVGIKDTMNDYWEKQYKFIEQLNEYVWKWIRQVRLCKAIPMKSSFINNAEDYFFTFNYTNVLERIYDVPADHILHIHGGLSPYCDKMPVLGHGNAEKIEEYREKAKSAAKKFNEGEESINNAIADYYERTFKNVHKCMGLKQGFFLQLAGVNNVEIIGHSFGDVDIPYFIYLKCCISKNAKWKFYCHSSEDYDAAEKAAYKLELDIGDYEILSSDCFWK